MESYDQRKTTEELQKALEWQKALFEGLSDAIMISDEHAMIIDVNTAACKLTGYSKDELTHLETLFVLRKKGVRFASVGDFNPCRISGSKLSMLFLIQNDPDFS